MPPVYLEAVHRILPLTTAAYRTYVEYYADTVLPAMRRHGMEMLGAWKRSGGPHGHDVMLFRFDSMDAYDRAAIALRADPEMARGRAAVATAFEIAETKKLVRPVSYGTADRLERTLAERPESPRFYLHAIVSVKPGRMAAACELISELADYTEARGWARIAAAYETLVGPANELTDLWVMSAPAPNISYRTTDPLAKWMEPLRDLAPDETSYYLSPLPFSPMQ